VRISVRLAFPAAGGGRIFAKDGECTDEGILGMPGLGGFVEGTEEDVYAVGLVKDMLRGFDVANVFCEFNGLSWLGWT
jgi:hypothetical protein